jgi:cell division protein ZapA
MSQSVVTVRLNGQPYQMGCDPGQEAHIEALAASVDSILQQLAGSVGQLGEARMLAMASLILADQTTQAGSPAPSAPMSDSPAATPVTTPAPTLDEEALAQRIEAAADQLKKLASQLAKA